MAGPSRHERFLSTFDDFSSFVCNIFCLLTSDLGHVHARCFIGYSILHCARLCLVLFLRWMGVSYVSDIHLQIHFVFRSGYSITTACIKYVQLSHTLGLDTVFYVKGGRIL